MLSFLSPSDLTWTFISLVNWFGSEKPQNTFDFEQFSKQIFKLYNGGWKTTTGEYQTKYNSVPSLNIRDKILNSMVVILYYSYVTLFYIGPNIIEFRP